MAGKDLLSKKPKTKGYSDGQAQSRFDKQAAFCAAGGVPPWDNSEGKWKKNGKVVGDPAGPFIPDGG